MTIEFLTKDYEGNLFAWSAMDRTCMCLVGCCYGKHFIDEIKPNRKIRVIKWNKDYPMCKHVTEIEKNVYLVTNSGYWCQQIYQFAHELTHVFIGGSNADNENNWFYETIAEVASNYFLYQMIKIFKSIDYLPSEYAKNIETYVTEQTRTAKAINIQNLKSWYRENEKELLENKEARELNAQVAKNLLPYFLKTPEVWNLLLFAPLENKPLNCLFDDWRDKIPEKYAFLRKHIKYFKSSFGI